MVRGMMLCAALLLTGCPEVTSEVVCEDVLHEMIGGGYFTQDIEGLVIFLEDDSEDDSKKVSIVAPIPGCWDFNSILNGGGQPLSVEPTSCDPHGATYELSDYQLLRVSSVGINSIYFSGEEFHTNLEDSKEIFSCFQQIYY
jgi:hypothetical protein